MANQYIEKEQWTTPTVTEFDISERTQSDPFLGSDLLAQGRDPSGGGDGGDGGGGGGGGGIS